MLKPKMVLASTVFLTFELMLQAPMAPAQAPLAAQKIPPVTAPPEDFFMRFKENDRGAARAFYQFD